MLYLKKIKSHVGLARYLHECDEEPVGFIPRNTGIPSPYAFGPTHAIWEHDSGAHVIVVETAHKVYSIFALDDNEREYATDDEAAAEYLRRKYTPAELEAAGIA